MTKIPRFLCSCCLVVCLVLSLSGAGQATSAEEQRKQLISYTVNSLYKMGLFQGTGIKSDGTPEFSLDRPLTRVEAVTMVIRLLGKEEAAESGQWSTSFTDVPTWAQQFVGYAYNNNLTNGISKTEFGSNKLIDENQYATLMLRALGYSSETDFDWDDPYRLFDQISLESASYNVRRRTFTRECAAYLSYFTLFTETKFGGKLISGLIQNNVINESAVLPYAPYGVYSELYEYNGKKYIGKRNNFLGLRHDFVTDTPYIDITAGYDDWCLLNTSLVQYFTLDTDNPYVDGEFLGFYQSGYTAAERQSYEIKFIGNEYLSATKSFKVYELIYNGKSFLTPSINDLDILGPYGSQYIGSKDGIRYIVYCDGNIGGISLNMNDLAKYFGINRKFGVFDPNRMEMGDGALIIEDTPAGTTS